MKLLSLSIVIFFSLVALGQPPRIHAHNDYEKPWLLFNAIQQKVFSIEADVFLIGDSLRVAHDAGAATTAPSLNTLYLQPIVALFATQMGTISNDSSYSPVLMIDIKKNGEAVLALLQQQLAAWPHVFNRTVNAKAVQVVISGDRGPIVNWKNYPPFILFDGRPYENYDSLSLIKVGFISDAYYNYVLGAGNMDTRIQQVAARVHSQGKLLRLWAAPDNPRSWNRLLKLGVDIINTDRVAACRKHFMF